MTAAGAIRIAHLSDLHFGAHLPALIAPLIDDIVAMQVDAVAISGDLTQHADPVEFRQAADFLAALPVPYVAVPGNHDIPGANLLERMTDPRGRWRRHVAAVTEPMLLLPGAALVGLDTVRRVQPHLDWSAGGISTGRRLRLEMRLRALAGRRLVVVAHHPLRHPAWGAGRASPLGAGAALATLRQAGVAAVLSGHLHRADVVGGSPPIVLAGSSLSHRTKGEPNSWMLVQVDAAGVRALRRVAYDGAWQAAETVVG
ncbi:metallophosphoesterase [Roseomonas sp. CECT 9278]|uniref:metallophosphoesterase family protein n=1 Tax=Roseomonas sp. CECT 9278 TaxID=2845823 RepID=UPI001E50D295|nr:metallophosphoesterase [Roseomonas sp. CECT 9278]CAH0261392.1 3',5'-cyclic adenosine monophosphate phosphodiesterase CpdA [Roseomonas sp. CECT 9278]